MTLLNCDFWAGRRVFVTGHMGFKGAWLCALLSRLGAETFGYGRDPRPRLLYRELELKRHQSLEGDINDTEMLRAALAGFGPEVVLHLAAQSLVLPSYADPVGTFDTNVMGTARVLDAARNVPSVLAVVVVTSDKVYRNNEWVWGYRETDPLGGKDPYSASKAAAEIVVQSMARSYFSDAGAARIATARAGNVIGGGDWADHRLLPDAARAFSTGQPLPVRNPHSSRPWQHVLDPLAGYLMLAERLLARKPDPLGAWNFGPSADDVLAVREVADLFVDAWGGGASWRDESDPSQAAREAGLLAIDSSLARKELGWLPRWKAEDAVTRTAYWYRRNAAGESAVVLVDEDIRDFLGDRLKGADAGV